MGLISLLLFVWICRSIFLVDAVLKSPLLIVIVGIILCLKIT